MKLWPAKWWPREAWWRDPGDMRVTPVDNPLDFREDGSIRAGDPAYDFMMEVLRTGRAGVARQRPDGTWETELFEDDEP